MSEPVVNLGKGLNEVSARQRRRKVNCDYHLKISLHCSLFNLLNRFMHSESPVSLPCGLPTASKWTC